MADLLTDIPTSLAIADADGQIVWRWTSDTDLRDALEDAGFRAGADFNERAVGTTGVGTAIQSGHLAVVVGSDHFVQAFHGWACVAAPIVDTLTGRTLGAVNVTSRTQDAGQFMHVSARALADQVSAAVSAAAGPAEERLMQAFARARRRRTGALVAMTDQLYLADAAAARLGLEHHEVWQRVRDAGPRAETIAVGDGATAAVWRVGPSLDDGVVLAIRRCTTLDGQTVGAAPRLTPLEQAEAKVIASVLEDCEGNKSLAAHRLGISRGTLYTKMRRHRLR